MSDNDGEAHLPVLSHHRRSTSWHADISIAFGEPKAGSRDEDYLSANTLPMNVTAKEQSDKWILLYSNDPTSRLAIPLRWRWNGSG